MKDEQRVYIKGNSERGSEVIKTLEDLGGKNLHSFLGTDITAYYFINPNGIINNSYSCGDNVFSYVKEFYREIKLPKWKPKYDENYYFINYKGMAMRNTWFNSVNEDTMFNFGNCFKTREEAEEARDKIKELLNNKA